MTPDNIDQQLPRLTALPQSIIDALSNEVRTMKRNAVVPIRPVPIFAGRFQEVALWSVDPNRGDGAYLISAQLFSSQPFHGGMTEPIPYESPGWPGAIGLFGTAMGAAAAGEAIEATGTAAVVIARDALRQIATQPRTFLAVGTGVIELTFAVAPLAAITVGLGGATVYIIYRCTTGAPVPLVCSGP